MRFIHNPMFGVCVAVAGVLSALIAYAVTASNADARWQEEKAAHHCELSIHKHGYPMFVHSQVNGQDTINVVQIPGVSTYHCDDEMVIRYED